MPIVQRSKCMKKDQVIDLILDEEISSDSEDDNDENMPIDNYQIKQPTHLTVTKCHQQQKQLSLHEQIVTSSDDEENIPLAKLVAAKRVVFKVLTKTNNNEANKLPLSNMSLNVNENSMKSKKPQDSTDSDDEDDIPLGVLFARKPLQNKLFACKPTTPSRKICKLNSLLKGIYDFWTECDSSDEDEHSTISISKQQQQQHKLQAETFPNYMNSPVLSLDKSTNKYILSLKNSKRKVFFK